MLRSEAVTRIQRWIGFRTDLETEIITALQDAQDELEGGQELPWFLRSEVSSITTVADEERVPLPSNFLREWEDDHMWVYDAAATEAADVWKPLLKLSLDQMRLDYPGTGEPKAYATSGLYWRIGPVPDDVYALKTIYYKADTVLTSDVENMWLKYASDLMIGLAGQKISVPSRDAEAFAAFQQMEIKATNRLLIENIQHEQQNRSNQMGGTD